MGTIEGLDLCRFDRAETQTRKELRWKEEVLVVLREDKELVSEDGSLKIPGIHSRRCEHSSQNLEMELLYALFPPFSHQFLIL